ncbi:MAG: hypothetical protein ACRD2W_25120 [Acidimicrobiales bacterium]
MTTIAWRRRSPGVAAASAIQYVVRFQAATTPRMANSIAVMAVISLHTREKSGSFGSRNQNMAASSTTDTPIEIETTRFLFMCSTPGTA